MIKSIVHRKVVRNFSADQILNPNFIIIHFGRKNPRFLANLPENVCLFGQNE